MHQMFIFNYFLIRLVLDLALVSDTQLHTAYGGFHNLVKQQIIESNSCLALSM